MDTKTEIIRLRKNGLSYKDISICLNMSVNTIKSVCRRLKVEKQSIDTNRSVCLLCKVSLTHTQGKKKKKYCSDTCRMKWWNTHLDKVNKQSYSEHICFNCQKTFQSYANNKRKYCSHHCYIASRFGGKQDDE
ncbi:sigma-70 family RNA polymerase sigma factor [Streptococcus porci]|uniref:sigma-70 family RNA polymerase sigma factor n=1 Tax=Streptococcus porci TaxID=502567 RepID=UPI000569BC87|nr:sigma-70 family RNA polymerase sigma factor [Streptococcus porci]